MMVCLFRAMRIEGKKFVCKDFFRSIYMAKGVLNSYDNFIILIEIISTYPAPNDIFLLYLVILFFSAPFAALRFFDFRPKTTLNCLFMQIGVLF